MASKNISQMIEKEVWRTAFIGSRKDNDLREDGDEDVIFENTFIEIENHASIDLKLDTLDRNIGFDGSEGGLRENIQSTENDKKFCSRIGFSSSVQDNVRRDHKGLLVDDAYDKNIDEVDYFDKDEEYMETHGQRFDVEDILDLYENSINKSSKSRYSEGVEQYKNISVYRRSIQNFATTNRFEIYDVSPDGNCMFRAIADQFMINGRIGYTADRLRCTAIDFLREQHNTEDGNHIQSFLCSESWEDYLSRMSKSSEWGDHIVLQAVADAYNLDVVVFNVFQDDIRKTEVHPQMESKRKPMTIFLGHIGEFHYLSLRPDHWTSWWPYKSLLFRVQILSHNLSPKEREKLIQNKIKDIAASEVVTQDEYLDKFQPQTEEREEKPNVDKGHTRSAEIHQNTNLTYFESYCIDELQLEETEESLNSVFFDPMHIDVLTGIPLPHLTYILKQLFPLYMINPYVGPRAMLIFQDIYVHYIGCFADGNNFVLKDISKNQTKRAFYNIHIQKRVGDVVLIPRDKHVQHTDLTGVWSPVVNIYADSSKSHPGYCRLKLSPNTTGLNERCIVQKESEKFLKEVQVNDVSLPGNVNIKYRGLLCETLPPLAQEWRVRERKFTFPSRRIIRSILDIKCTLIKKAHPQSKEPDIEWKYNFSMAEQIIFKIGLTESQLHGFLVFKVLMDNATFLLSKRLKNKHLKAVYFNALEDIPCEAWETNFSGCILYVLSFMITLLKARFLPHYFIPSNNLIDCFSLAEIDAICVNVECIRMFPVAVIQNIAENHGYSYAPKLIKMVFANCKSFVANKNLATDFISAFTPGTLSSVKVMTRLGFYETAFQLLQYVHEQMLLMPMTDDCYEKPCFMDFFHTALKSLHQRSSRIILAKLCDLKFKTDILSELIDKNKTFARDVLPWEVDYRVEWTELPKEKVTDFSALADIFYSYSLREYNKRNSTLATLALETAIPCIHKAIEEVSINVDEIQDQNLREEIISQRDKFVMDQKKSLRCTIFK
ncbi:uncharacterized protein LOC133187369 [Saccostrea echinata]|uniref:uncharacterized protein LOC133187369 n=1 Tax=Saccostrea echinata TaxID=191078 RepID=UPI002A81C85B|nr:uncharacterized protein LOC133187369 [Saccostrea echinata]